MKYRTLLSAFLLSTSLVAGSCLDNSVSEQLILHHEGNIYIVERTCLDDGYLQAKISKNGEPSVGVEFKNNEKGTYLKIDRSGEPRVTVCDGCNGDKDGTIDNVCQGNVCYDPSNCLEEIECDDWMGQAINDFNEYSLVLGAVSLFCPRD